jgi:hypothetical protein
MGPDSDLMLRASLPRATAPNIGELYNLGSRFDASISDRCSNVARGRQLRRARRAGTMQQPADFGKHLGQSTLPELLDSLHRRFQLGFAVDG